MCSRYLPCKNTICRRNIMPIPHFLTWEDSLQSRKSAVVCTATAAILVQQTKQISVHGPLDFDLWLLPTVSRSFSNPVDISLSLTQFILSGKPWLSGERQYPDTVMVYFFIVARPHTVRIRVSGGARYEYHSKMKAALILSFFSDGPLPISRCGLIAHFVGREPASDCRVLYVIS